MKKLVTLLLALAMALGLCACAGNGGTDGASTSTAPAAPSGDSAAQGGDPATDLAPITFSFFDKNKGDLFDDDVAREITKRTGVTLDIQQPTTDSEEKLNLMLTAGDYSDIIMFDRSSASLQSYIDSAALLPLNDLIAAHGKNVQSMYGEVLDMSRYPDGNNYYLNSWYGMDPDPVYGVAMRMDYLRAFVGDKAATGDPFTLDEYYDMLVRFKSEHPDIGGAAPIPLSVNGEALGTTLGVLKGMYGIKSYHVDGDKLQYDLRSPQYVNVFTFLNKCYREGLIDPEWVSVKQDLWEQKLASDAVFSTMCAWWSPGTANTTLQSAHDDVEAQFYTYKVVPAGIDPDTGMALGGRSTLGWDGIAISDKCKDPDRAMQFLDYLASEEGQYLLLWGVEGTHWDMVDGKHTPKPEIIEALAADINKVVVETGIRKWMYCVKNGNGSDGTPYDMIYKRERGIVDAFAINALRNTNYDYTEFQGLTNFDPNSDEAMANQAITEEITKYQPKIITAASEADCVRLYEELIANIDKLGAEKVEAAMTKTWLERKALWN